MNSNGRKNTLQADVTAAGDSGSPVVVKAYVGDSDGKYWRFTFDSSGSISRTELVDTDQPIYSSSALLFVGTTDRYLFFGTGSDLLANTTPGGGATGSGEAFKLYGVKDGPTSGTVTLTTLNPRSCRRLPPADNGDAPRSPAHLFTTDGSGDDRVHGRIPHVYPRGHGACARTPAAHQQRVACDDRG